MKIIFITRILISLPQPPSPKNYYTFLLFLIVISILQHHFAFSSPHHDITNFYFVRLFSNMYSNITFCCLPSHDKSFAFCAEKREYFELVNKLEAIKLKLCILTEFSCFELVSREKLFKMASNNNFCAIEKCKN